MNEMPVNQVFNVPPAHDPVTNPAHYTWLPVEPIEILEHLIGNRYAACKYLIRAGRKDPDKELEDLEKALWHVSREIARVKRARDGETEMVSETFFNGQNKVIREDIFSDTSQSVKERRFTAGHLRDGKLRMWDVTNGEWVTFNVREWQP